MPVVFSKSVGGLYTQTYFNMHYDRPRRRFGPYVTRAQQIRLPDATIERFDADAVARFVQDNGIEVEVGMIPHYGTFLLAELPPHIPGLNDTYAGRVTVNWNLFLPDKGRFILTSGVFHGRLMKSRGWSHTSAVFPTDQFATGALTTILTSEDFTVHYPKIILNPGNITVNHKVRPQDSDGNISSAYWVTFTLFVISSGVSRVVNKLDLRLSDSFKCNCPKRCARTRSLSPNAKLSVDTNYVFL